MHIVLVAGAGTIGTTIAEWLAHFSDYHVHLIDIEQPDTPQQTNLTTHALNINNALEASQFIKQHHVHAVISALPYYCNDALLQLAIEHQLHYFDPTEDIHITRSINHHPQPKNSAIVPHCGLAPGFINIVTHDLIQQFDTVEQAQLRVGALPQTAANALHYHFSWSIDGLINEYLNPCHVLDNGRLCTVDALTGLEELEIEGRVFEAFHTSGGLASLANTYQGLITQLDYKTLRYPGHAEKMRFLLNDMKLKSDRALLRHILANAIPFTDDDMVVVWSCVTGEKNNRHLSRTFCHRYYPTTVFDKPYSAIQFTTTAGISAIVDLVLSNPEPYKGLVQQTAFSLAQVFDNRFGCYLNPHHQAGK